jgi:TatD DNase family protein
MTSDPSQYVRTREKGSRDVTYPAPPEPLAVAVYDNHCHLEIADGDDPLTLDEQLDRALDVGVAGVVQAGGDIESSVWSAEAAASHPRVLAAVAIHPNEAPAYAEAGRLGEAIAVIDELAAQPRVRAIGETGLDFFRTEEPGLPAQFESFEAHIALARTSRSPRSTASRCRSTTATRTMPCSRPCGAWALPSAPCSTASPETRPWPASLRTTGTT